MGYKHRLRKATCGYCEKQSIWNWTEVRKVSSAVVCRCGARNHLRAAPVHPPVPKSLYIGPDRLTRVKLYPVPPDEPDAAWAQPYSIRSFVYQVSKKFGACGYACSERGKVMGEPVFRDYCAKPEEQDAPWAETWECHLVNGWTTGQDTCPLWQNTLKLCQTPSEQRFLHRYIGYVKDRQFPMLIPQTWIGIAERRRPDFVAFVPLQYWRYKWLAIQLDGAHGEEQARDDFDRDMYIEGQNYNVVSLRPNEKGYLEEVRRLVEQFEEWMALAETDPRQVAVDAAVIRSEPPEEIPF